MEKTYPVLGHSMRFLLEPGDSAAAESCAPGALRAGEVALLVKWDGGRPAGYVIHRVLLNFTAGGRRLLLTKGDANLLPDFPPSAFQPVGRVTEVESGGRRFSAAPAKAWPLVSLYSFAANKLLSLSALAAAVLFYCFRALLPSGAHNLLNRLYLGWEENIYPAAARAVRLAALPEAASSAAGERAPAALKTGRIRRNETWSGKITVADYLTIERGAAVTVLPGTELSFERREPWFFPVLRAGSGGELRELESASAKILVYGGFSAVGSTGAAVTFSGSSFGGVHALGGGKISLEGCRLENSSACALSGRDQSRLEVRDCGFINCRGGLEVSGRASVSALNCLVSGSAGPGLGVMDDAAASVSGGLVAACAGSGVEVSGRAFAGFSGLKIESCAAGASMSGRAAVFLKRCGLNKNSGHGAQLAGAVLFSAADCGFSGNAAGLKAKGRNAVSLDGCLFENHAGPGVELAGHNLLKAGNCRFEACVSGVEGRGLNRAEIYGSTFTKCGGPALKLERAAACLLKNCSFSGNKAGVHAAACRELVVENSVFEGNPGPGLQFKSAGLALVKGCSFFGNKAGINVRGCRTLKVEDSVFKGNTGPGIRLETAGLALVKGSSFSGNDAGFHALACRELSVENSVFDGNTGPAVQFKSAGAVLVGNCAFYGNKAGVNARDCRALTFENSVFKENPGPGVQFESAGAALVRDCSFSGNKAGIKESRSQSLTIASSVFSGNSGPGLSAEGRGALSLRRSRFYRNGAGAACSGKGPASFVSCLFEEQGGPAATFSGGGPAEFADCSFKRNKAGLSFSGGCQGKVAACAFTGNGAPALEVYSRAGVSFSDSASEGGPSALHLDGGSAVLSKVRISGTPFPGVVCGDWTRLRADQVSYEGRPWVKPVERRGQARRRRGVFLFAAGTAHLPFFSSLYKLFYLSALPAARLLLGVPGLRALYLYRGMAARGWVAGLSDMDLACVLEPAGAREDLALYSALRRRLRVLKAIFPFTGEVMLASAGEFASFLNCWGVKGAEFQASSRLLAGRPVELDPAPPAAGPADLTEAFYAYTLLTRHFLASGLPEAFTRRNCLKNLVDVKRYLAAPAPERGSRAAYARVLGLPLEGFMALDRGDAAYGAFLALHQASGGADGGIVLGPAVAAAGGGWLNRAAFDAACRELAGAAGLDLGVVLDSLYRVYIVLPDSSAQNKAAYLRVCAALGRAPAGSPLAGASPVVLTQGAFALLCRLPYLNNPAFGLDLGAGGSLPGLTPSDGGVYSSGLSYAGPSPEAGQLRAMASLAARHFCASWRSLWTEMPPHYFYTRALGLRLLLEDGRALPFSRPELLRAAFEGKPGERLPGWDAYCAGGAGAANYLFIAEQAAALGRLADAC